MQLELVEVYDFPFPKNAPRRDIKRYTAHFYLIDWNVDLRGVIVLQGEKSSLKVHLPSSSAFDKEQKKMVRYPIINFIDREQHKQVLKEMKRLLEEHFS